MNEAIPIILYGTNSKFQQHYLIHTCYNVIAVVESEPFEPPRFKVLRQGSQLEENILEKVTDDFKEFMYSELNAMD